MLEVAADADALGEDVERRPGRPGVRVAERHLRVDPVADRLHARPSPRGALPNSSTAIGDSRSTSQNRLAIRNRSVSGGRSSTGTSPGIRTDRIGLRRNPRSPSSS